MKWLSWLKGNDKTIIEMLDKQSANLVNATQFSQNNIRKQGRKY